MMVKRKPYKTSSAKQSISTEEGLVVAGKVVRAAQENKIDCALYGGLAMHVFGFTRATLDVDFIAAGRLPLPVSKHLQKGGETYQVKASGEKEIEVDWIIRDDDRREVYKAALAGATSTEDGLQIITTEWMVILKYLAGRGKDQIDLLWLLREEGLVDRALVEQHIKSLFGQFAFWPLADTENLFLEADVMKAEIKMESSSLRFPTPPESKQLRLELNVYSRQRDEPANSIGVEYGSFETVNWVH